MNQTQINKILESLDVFILATKATGGYKYQEKFRLSEKDITDYVTHGRDDLRKAIISLLIAEEILQEPGYWDRTPRWKEYLERREEAMKAVKT